MDGLLSQVGLRRDRQTTREYYPESRVHCKISLINFNREIQSKVRTATMSQILLSSPPVVVTVLLEPGTN